MYLWLPALVSGVVVEAAGVMKEGEEEGNQKRRSKMLNCARLSFISISASLCA
jgi:hypothetical protein